MKIRTKFQHKAHVENQKSVKKERKGSESAPL